MTVTQITELTKSRSKVYIEQQFAFVLYKGELRLYHIREGASLSEEVYEEIMKKVLPKRAKLRAMNLLKSKDYTRQQLITKLEQGLYPDDVIEEAVAYVESYHYIDDLRYAVSYIRCCADSRSRRRIEQDLMKKGISKSILLQAWNIWAEDGGEQDELQMIRSLLEKRHYDLQSSDIKERRRIYGYLLRKGYEPEKIQKVMSDRGFEQ